MLTRRSFAVSLLLVPMLARRAAAQSDFGGGRPEERYFSVEARVVSGRRGPMAEGYVYNRYDFHADRVRVALTPADAAGRPLGTITAYVAEVPPHSRSFFQVPLPQEPASVTARVESFEWTPRGGGGGGGM